MYYLLAIPTAIGVWCKKNINVFLMIWLDQNVKFSYFENEENLPQQAINIEM